MTEDILVAGQVRQVRTTGRYRYATVDPLAISDETKANWLPIPDPQSMFPSRGCVFWHDAQASLAESSLWEFRLEECEGYGEGGGKKEKYQVVNPRPLYEVVDLRSYDDERELREELTTGQGLFLRTKPIMPKLFLWIEDEILIGPIDMKSDEEGRWKIDYPKDSEKLISLHAWVPQKDLLEEVPIGSGKRMFVPPGENRGRHKGFRNWGPDELLIRRALARLKKHDPAVLEEYGLKTKRMIEEYAIRVAGMGLVGEALERELARKERIAELSGVIDRNVELVREAAEVLLVSEKVKEELERLRAMERERIREEEERKIREEISGKKRQLAEINSTIGEREERLAALEEEIDEAGKRLQEKAGEFESALAERLRGLIGKPESVFPDLVLFERVFSGKPTNLREDAAGLRFAELFRMEDDPRIVDDITQSVGIADVRIRSESIGQGGLARSLFAGFLSGHIPLVDGQDAYAVLSSFADTVAGGRLLWIPVPSTYYEPQDLFGRTGPDGRFMPNPSGLLGLMSEAAERPDELYLVVLDGFNRSAVDSYLMSIVNCRQDAIRGRFRGIPLCARLGANVSVASVARAAWPENVLLALIPAGKEVSIPFSVEFLKAIAPISLRASDGSGLARLDGETSKVPKTRMSTAAWRGKIAEVASAFGEVRVPDGIASLDVSLGMRVSVSYRECLGASNVAGMESEESKRFGIVTGVLPYVFRISRNPKETLERARLSVDEETMSKLSVLMSKLGG
jgi:hypothetical protein